jgi:putative ABC transport system permease protein
MNNKALTIGRLSLSNLKRKPIRSAGLITITAVLSFVLFAGGVLSVSMRNGLESVKARFGADLMAVPLGYDEGIEGILLKGEPNYFYFDKSKAEEIEKIDGVKSVSPQFFLTSTNQDCCDIPVQFIGFDPDTDFSIQPWIKEVYNDKIKDGDLIIGSDIEPKDGNQLKFFGKEYNVAAKLEKTGTGLDQAVYANMNTLMDLFSSAKQSGFSFTDNIDPENSISTVLIKTEDGYDLDEVVHNIRSKTDGLQIVKTTSMMTGIADNLGSLVTFIYIFAALFLIVAAVTLTIIFSVIANERKKEFAILRILGATGEKLSQLVITEALLISAIGGIIGTALSALVVFSFNVYIGDKLNLPYLQPTVSQIIVIALAAFLISLLLGAISSMYSALKISKRETYAVMREGE